MLVTLVADTLKRHWLCVLGSHDHLLAIPVSPNLIWWEGYLSCFVMLLTSIKHNHWYGAKEVNKVTKAMETTQIT